MAIGSCVVDTNVLLRMTRRSDPKHQLVDAALTKLVKQATVLYYTHAPEHR
jgi:predicted nucleic acid-binding protein